MAALAKAQPAMIITKAIRHGLCSRPISTSKRSARQEEAAKLRAISFLAPAWQNRTLIDHSAGRVAAPRDGPEEVLRLLPPEAARPRGRQVAGISA